VSGSVPPPDRAPDPGPWRPAVRAFLGLGSNLGDRRRLLADAVAGLPDVVAVSPLYETDPVGGPAGQGPFLNCVVELSTTLDAHALLRVAQAAEAAARRVRRERWGPRTLDVDVLLLGDERIDDDELTVPHPRMWDRAFVLVPLADLAPEIAAAPLAALAADPDRGVAGSVRPAGTLTWSETDGTRRRGRNVDSHSGPPVPLPTDEVGPAPTRATRFDDRDDWRRALAAARRDGATVGLVPTGRTLHGGPLSLLRRAAASCACVGVTLAADPGRDLDADVALAGTAGATHVVVVPGLDPVAVRDDVAAVAGAALTGPPVPGRAPAGRPARGDEIVVVVGEKDAEALAALRRLLADPALPVVLVTAATVRTTSGLALSGANAALDPDDRVAATKLYWALLAGKRAIEEDGVTDARAVEAVIAAALAGSAGLTLDRVAAVVGDDLVADPTLAGEVHLLVSAHLGPVHIDDTIVATVPDAVPPAAVPPGVATPAAGPGED
jgi:2-amino-4-hydroxy-6-hydroxymethyldihydropteridine diphosphokinase